MVYAVFGPRAVFDGVAVDPGGRGRVFGPRAVFDGHTLRTYPTDSPFGLRAVFDGVRLGELNENNQSL